MLRPSSNVYRLLDAVTSGLSVLVFAHFSVELSGLGGGRNNFNTTFLINGDQGLAYPGAY